MNFRPAFVGAALAVAALTACGSTTSDAGAAGLTSQRSTEAACAADFQTMTIAVQAYLAATGGWPSTQSRLVESDYLRNPSTRFTLGSGGSVLPASGSPCTQRTDATPTAVAAASTTTRPSADCAADKGAIEVALFTYVSRGNPPPYTEAVLVDAGLLDADSESFDIDAAGVVVPTSGGPCA